MIPITKLLVKVEDARQTWTSHSKTFWKQWSPVQFIQKARKSHVDKLVIGPKTSAKGRLQADEIIVEGEVDGRIASRKLTVTQTGKLVGRVVAQSLKVEEQAEMDAVCRVHKERNEPKSVEPTGHLT